MDPARIEGLHEDASSRYLQGDLEGALAAWQEVLAADPGDDRALEGVRLCDQLIGSQSESVCTSGRSPFAVGTATPADLPDLPPAKGPAVPAADPGQLDLSDLAEESPPPTPRPLAASWQFGEVKCAPTETPQTIRPAGAAPRAQPVAPAKPADDPPPRGADPAQVELRRRVNELITEVLRAVEHGEVDSALRTIDRILLLDEENPTALSLRAKLGSGQEGPAAGRGARAQAEAPPVAEVPERRPFGASQIAPAEELTSERFAVTARPTEALRLDPVPPREAATPREALPPILSLEDDLPPLDELLGEETPAPQAPAASALPRGASRVRLRLGPRVIGVGALAALAAVVAGGWWIWSASNGQTPQESATSETAARPPRDEIAQEAGAASQAGGAREATASSPETPAERFAAVLARAERAEAEGNLSAAVLALAEAVKLRPDDEPLRARFTVLAQRYRVEQEREEQWQGALRAFEEGNYSQALSVFYRMEAGAHPEIERYKLYGWYNLGLQAMRSGDCESARQHLKEARQLSGSDAHVRTAYELAHRCAVTRDRAWTQGVADLGLRELDD